MLLRKQGKAPIEFMIHLDFFLNVLRLFMPKPNCQLKFWIVQIHTVVVLVEHHQFFCPRFFQLGNLLASRHKDEEPSCSLCTLVQM